MNATYIPSLEQLVTENYIRAELCASKSSIQSIMTQTLIHGLRKHIMVTQVGYDQ